MKKISKLAFLVVTSVLSQGAVHAATESNFLDFGENASPTGRPVPSSGKDMMSLVVNFPPQADPLKKALKEFWSRDFLQGVRMLAHLPVYLGEGISIKEFRQLHAEELSRAKSDLSFYSLVFDSIKERGNDLVFQADGAFPQDLMPSLSKLPPALVLVYGFNELTASEQKQARENADQLLKLTPLERTIQFQVSRDLRLVRPDIKGNPYDFYKPMP